MDEEEKFAEIAMRHERRQEKPIHVFPKKDKYGYVFAPIITETKESQLDVFPVSCAQENRGKIQRLVSLVLSKFADVFVAQGQIEYSSFEIGCLVGLQGTPEEQMKILEKLDEQAAQNFKTGVLKLLVGQFDPGHKMSLELLQHSYAHLPRELQWKIGALAEECSMSYTSFYELQSDEQADSETKTYVLDSNTSPYYERKILSLWNGWIQVKAPKHEVQFSINFGYHLVFGQGHFVDFGCGPIWFYTGAELQEYLSRFLQSLPKEKPIEWNLDYVREISCM